LEHALLHFHVDFHIDVCRVDVGVAQPVADHIDIIARPQQMHGCGMADSVRVDGFGGNGWALVFSYDGVFSNDVAHTEAGNGRTVGVEEELLSGWIFCCALLEIIL